MAIGRLRSAAAGPLLPGLAVFALASLVACGGPQPSGENVVLIVIDTLRQDHLACYGYSRRTSPVLDRLAAEGARFNAMAPSSWTKTSTASLLTGLHPLRHQALDRTDRLPAGVMTLAERLRAVGYRTRAASGNGWVSGDFGFDRGFERFRLLIARPGDEPSGDEVTAAALGTIPGEGRKPFFLYVHYMDPHAPYRPRQAWDGGPLPAALRAGLSVAEIDGTRSGPRSPEFLARARDLYDGDIRDADDAVGALLDNLARRHLLDRTLVIVTGDHGEEFTEHGRMSHGQSLYEEAVRVPLIIRGPGIPPGPRSGAASLLDIVPTVLGRLGLGGSGDLGLDGIDLSPTLSNPAALVPSRPILLYLDFEDGTSLALLDGTRKLVLAQEPYRKEFFDLASDPHEQHSLLQPGQSVPDFAALARRLAEEHNRLRKTALTRESTRPSAEISKQLAALGYLRGAAAGERPRGISARIRPAERMAFGNLGWEDLSIGRCLRTGEPAQASLLLSGWYPPEIGGRWSAPHSLLALPYPGPSATRLEIQGVNFRQDTPRLRMTVEGEDIVVHEVPPGDFSLVAELGTRRYPRLTVLVEMNVEPPFVPATQGLADDRTLGLFVTRVCFE